MRAPERVLTARLLLRRPRLADAEAIFARYSSDPDVTRYVGWPAHTTVDDTREFLAFCDDQWDKWPAGPYLVCSRTDGMVLGGTGLMFETPQCAMTGYVLATDAWGRGYATEALSAMITVAQDAGVHRLYALCHAGHRASAHVLEKCGFVLEETRHAHAEFPNLRPGERQDVLCYARILENASGHLLKPVSVQLRHVFGFRSCLSLRPLRGRPVTKIRRARRDFFLLGGLRRSFVTTPATKCS